MARDPTGKAPPVRTALYAGSFDPATNGHLDIIKAALDIADRVVVAIGVHHGKLPLFSFDERAEMLTEATKSFRADRVSIARFEGLVVEAAKANDATLLIRGVRDGTDLDYEIQMAGMNAAIAPGLRTIFLPGSPEVRHISATLVRQIANLGGDIAPFVPPNVARKLTQKFAS